MDSLFVAVPVIIGIGFVVVFGVLGAAVVRGTMQWRRNNASPVVTVPSRVVAKRAHTSGGAGDTSASTTYYVTFEQEGGARVEMHTSAKDYGMLAERDAGMLTYQGTRYKGFQRTGS